MKTRLIPILTVAATVGAILSAHAIEALDSSQFAYKYEMLELPTAQNLDGSGANDFTGINSGATWCTLGTGADTGTVYMVISGGQNLISANVSGTAGDVWQNLGVTAASGYTIETRLKVTECTGANGTLLLNASYGVVNHNSWLQFYGNKITWGSNVLTNMDTSAWHTYRLVGKDNVYRVYVDGVLAKDSLGNGYGNDNLRLNRLIFGGGGTGYAGKARVAFLRFTKGAYAPLSPREIEKANRLKSDEFDVKYEMSADDTRISTSANASDWTISGTSGVAISNYGGILSVVPEKGKQPYWRTTDAAWKNAPGMAVDAAYTLEFSAQIKSCTHDDGDRTLQFFVASPLAVGNIIIGTNHVYWQVSTSMADNILLDESDNTDKMHKFRIAFDGETRDGFTVWRDDVMIGSGLADFAAVQAANNTYARFGIPGRTSGGAFDINYIRWKIGGVYPPDTRQGMKIVIR